MIVVKTLPEFDVWLRGLRDKTAQRRLLARLRKASPGNLGDVASVGGGVSEMREHFGPGCRLYFTQRGEVLIESSGGGDKSSQAADIRSARRLAARIED